MGMVIFLGTMRNLKQQILTLANTIKVCVIAIGKCFLYMPRLLIFMFPCLLYHTPVFFFRGSPMKVKGPVRAARRYTVKTALGVEQKAEVALKELQTELAKRRENVGRYQGPPGNPTPLADFLGVYDMLIMVDMYLHYVDVLNLAAVSRSVRESVLPATDLHRRLTVFNQYTCCDRERRRCWACPNQTCAGCYQLPLVPQVPVVYHLEQCVPYCTPCYYKHVAHAQPKKKNKYKSARCKCAPNPPEQQPNFYQRYIDILGTPKKTQRSLETLPRSVCRECNKLTSEELVAKKTEAAKSMLMKGLKSDGEKWLICAKQGCGNRLGSGPRFWICPKARCGGECISTLHQAWGESRNGGEDEIVGDESV